MIKLMKTREAFLELANAEYDKLVKCDRYAKQISDVINKVRDKGYRVIIVGDEVRVTQHNPKIAELARETIFD